MYATIQLWSPLSKDRNNSDNGDHCAGFLNVWTSLDAAKPSVIASAKPRGYSVWGQLDQMTAYGAGEQERKWILNTYKYKEIEKKH